MDTQPSIEMRIESLETSLNRTRRFSLFLALLLVLFVTSAFGGRKDELRTSKLILMETEFSPGVILVAGPHSSLVIQTPGGSEILRLGGDPVRLVGEE